MKAKTKFLKMFYKLPDKSKVKLVYNAYGDTPMTLFVVMCEVRNDTRLSRKILKDLGYVDEDPPIK